MTFEDLIITNNIVDVIGGIGSGGGGGIYIESAGGPNAWTPHMSNIIISNNQVLAGYGGGGIYQTSYTTLYINNSIIENNIAPFGGGAYYQQYGHTTYENVITLPYDNIYDNIIFDPGNFLWGNYTPICYSSVRRKLPWGGLGDSRPLGV